MAPQLSELSAHTIAYLPLINIVADGRGNFGGRTTLDDNRIVEIPPGLEPEFLEEFRDKLTQRRWVKPETV